MFLLSITKLAYHSSISRLSVIVLFMDTIGLESAKHDTPKTSVDRPLPLRTAVTSTQISRISIGHCLLEQQSLLTKFVVSL